MDWQTIESAPRDGTLVLLTDGYHLAVAAWVPELYPHADQRNAYWAISDWHNEPIHLRGGYAATHWMPLPAPPGGDR